VIALPALFRQEPAVASGTGAADLFRLARRLLSKGLRL